jgi:hypothetical protein
MRNLSLIPLLCWALIAQTVDATTARSIQSLSESPSEILPRAYLPVIATPPIFFYGHVTQGGLPVANRTVRLLYGSGIFSDGDCQTARSSANDPTSITNSEGRYSFPSPPPLQPGGCYDIRYEAADHPNISGDLARWEAVFTGSATLTGTLIPSFDVQDVQLLAPAAQSTLSLPVTFRWRNTRPAHLTEQYKFTTHYLRPNGEGFLTSGEKQSVESYTLVKLDPSGLFFSAPADWSVLIYGQNGLGVSTAISITYVRSAITFVNPIQ